MKIKYTPIKNRLRKIGDGAQVRQIANPALKKDKLFADNHLVVRFKDGNREEQIEKFKAFCNGNLSSHLKLGDVYVFETAEHDADNIEKLVEASKELDYVEAVGLDKIMSIKATTGSLNNKLK